MSLRNGNAWAAVLGAMIWASAAGAEVIDRVLAVVDREPILQSDLFEDIARELEFRAQAGVAQSGAITDELLRQALNEAINRKILLREAQLNSAMYPGLQVTDEEVEEQIARLREAYGSNEQFLKDLEASGENMNDIRMKVRQQIMQRNMAQLKRAQFGNQIVVTESEIAQYYQDNIGQYQRPERVRLRQIFLEAGSTDGERATARARMEQVLSELNNGANFQEMAKQYSQAIGAEDGGIVGWTNRGDLVPALDEAAFQLAEGAHSGVIETPTGFHVLFAETKEEAGLAALDEVRTEIEPKIREQAALGMYQSWLDEQRKRSRVQIFL